MMGRVFVQVGQHHVNLDHIISFGKSKAGQLGVTVTGPLTMYDDECTVEEFTVRIIGAINDEADAEYGKPDPLNVDPVWPPDATGPCGAEWGLAGEEHLVCVLELDHEGDHKSGDGKDWR